MEITKDLLKSYLRPKDHGALEDEVLGLVDKATTPKATTPKATTSSEEKFVFPASDLPSKNIFLAKFLSFLLTPSCFDLNASEMQSNELPELTAEGFFTLLDKLVKLNKSKSASQKTQEITTQILDKAIAELNLEEIPEVLKAQERINNPLLTQERIDLLNRRLTQISHNPA